MDGAQRNERLREIGMNRPGLRFMVLSALAFSLMTVCVKWASARISPAEIVFARALISLVLSALFLWRAKVPWWGEHRGLLFLRGLFGFLGLHCVFYAVAHLPLAEATVLQYMHPIFTALLAMLVLGESLGRGVVAGIGLSVLGLLFVAQPDSAGLGLDPFGVAVALGGAFFSACAYVTVRRLASSEHPLVIVLYFPLVTVPLTLPAVLADPVWPLGLEWLALLGVGVFAQVGQVALTHGMRHEPAARATALSYLQVVFAVLWGFGFFGELPAWATLLGAILILAGSFVAGRER